MRYTFDMGKTSSHCMEVIYWMRRTGKFLSELKPVFQTNIIDFEKTLFAGVCDDRILIGHERGIKEYNTVKETWLCVYRQNFHIPCKEHGKGIRYCVTKNAVVICGGISMSKFQENNRVHLLLFDGNDSQYLRKVTCPTLLPFNINNRDILVSLTNNRVILAGMYSVFIGEISVTRDDVKWNQIKSFNRQRKSPLIFQMSQFIYVIGGTRIDESSCERYDFRTKNWEVTRHVLPPRTDLSFSSIIVSHDQSLAIIIGCQLHTEWGPTKLGLGHVGDKMIIFCETNGFSVVDSKNFATKIPFFNKRHVSILG